MESFNVNSNVFRMKCEHKGLSHFLKVIARIHLVSALTAVSSLLFPRVALRHPPSQCLALHFYCQQSKPWDLKNSNEFLRNNKSFICRSKQMKGYFAEFQWLSLLRRFPNRILSIPSTLTIKCLSFLYIRR